MFFLFIINQLGIRTIKKEFGKEGKEALASEINKMASFDVSQSGKQNMKWTKCHPL